MDEVATSLKACLQSTKGGVLSLYHLNRDYESVEGEKIPYRSLGFPTLEAFIDQVPGLRKSTRQDGIYIEVIPDEKTAHLAELIRKQRAPKKRRRPTRQYTSFRRPTISSFPRNNVTTYAKPTPRVSAPPVKFPTYPKLPYRPPSKIPAMHVGEVKVYSPKPPEQPATPVKPQQTRPEVQQRLHQAQTFYQIPQHRPPVPQTPAPNNNPQVRPNLNIPTAQNTVPSPSKAAQSAPVHSFNTNPFKDHLNGGNTERQINRQNSLPQVPSSGPKVDVTPDRRQVPHLKVAKPLSERLKRVEPESEPQVVFTPTVKPCDTPVSPNLLTPPPEDSEDPRDELSRMMRKLNLGSPKYKEVKNLNKEGKQTIFCLVEVGSERFSSFPFDTVDKAEAARLAATSALNALHRQHGPPTRMRVTTDIDTIQQRLVAIVEMHTSGVFMEKLAGYYTDKHDETLPHNWMEMISQCRELTMDKGAQNTIIVRKNPAPLTPRARVDILSPPITPLSPSKTTNPFLHSFNTTIPALILPKDTLFPVYVSHVASIAEIFVRSLDDDNNKNFFDMCMELTQYYTTMTEPALSVSLGHNYVMKIDDECLRVRVEDLDPETGDAEVFFIDTGESDVVECSKLYPLKPQFTRVPAQAIRVSLFIPEGLPVCDTTTKSAEIFLLDKTFYLEALSREEDDLSHVVVGIFYDTSGDNDVQINDRITQDVLDKMEMSRLDVKLAIGGRLLEVLMSHIEYNGDVYLQSKNDGLLILSNMLNSLMESVLEDKDMMKKAQVTSSGLLNTTELYLAQKADKNWVRVQVAYKGSTNSKMRMVDYGQLLTVDRRKLFKLRELSEAIAKFPLQAAQVELHNVRKSNFTERMEARLRQMAPSGEPLLCKVYQGREFNRNAVVELFRRSQPDNCLISINNTLELEPVLVESEDGNNNVKTKKRVDRTFSRGSSLDDSSKILKPPTIPAVGEDFEVHVTKSAANPGNFMVQPFEYAARLKSMIENMQKTYGKIGASLGVSSPKEGSFYAARNHDGTWCRACVNKLVDDHSVAVYLCDFGNLAVIGNDQLQVLRKEFYELPQQAIKARLVGIKPINVDWTISSCMRFQELVQNKDFLSKVMILELDKLVPSGLVLGLDLIDISQDEPVHIHDILINEKYAAPEGQ